MEPLIHCIYASGAKPGVSQREIREILQVARRKNAQLGISGMLLYTDGSFFQVLEGEESAVNGIYSTIARDPRHACVTKIICEPIAARSFSDWTMGFSEMSRQELARVDGLNDFFLGRSCLHELEAGRAKRLLAAFAEGRWRTLLLG